MAKTLTLQQHADWRKCHYCPTLTTYSFAGLPICPVCLAFLLAPPAELSAKLSAEPDPTPTDAPDAPCPTPLQTSAPDCGKAPSYSPAESGSDAPGSTPTDPTDPTETETPTETPTPVPLSEPFTRENRPHSWDSVFIRYRQLVDKFLKDFSTSQRPIPRVLYAVSRSNFFYPLIVRTGEIAVATFPELLSDDFLPVRDKNNAAIAAQAFADAIKIACPSVAEQTLYPDDGPRLLSCIYRAFHNYIKNS